MKLVMPKGFKKFRRILLLPLLAFGIFLAVSPRLMQDVSFSRAVYDRHGELLRLTLSRDEKYRLFVPLDRISPMLTEAVLLHEDRYFYDHPGINPVALARAAWRHFGGGGRGGASTLTMQLARLKYGIHSHNVAGKLWQMAEALRIELHYSKKEILEAYLNLAPYGGNVEGVSAAGRIYFGRDALGLSLPEALTLAVVPQSPHARMPGKNPASDAALVQARLREFPDWVAAHPADARFASLLARPMRYGSRRDLPFATPQWTTRILREHTGGNITTTLDAPLQQELALLLQRAVAHRSELGIANAAALLVDTRDMSVLASIGSADYFNLAHQGMVDGTRARRSPGSALKPFIYALAFDGGLIHPMSLLSDAPASYGAYVPENFDRDYQGPMSAHDALIKSRNIPALWLTGHLAHPDFYHFLQAAGIGKLKAQETYGLSLALGGAEVTMEELVKLYAMLAGDGVLHDLRRVKDEPAPPGKRLLSPEAAFMTLDILKDNVPPGGSAAADALPLPVYWKTGTSQGLRDAWTVGVFGPYALAVWVGDFRGSRHGQYVGILHAAPLFFDLVRATAAREHAQDRIEAKAPHLKLSRSLACTDTGDVDNPYCASRAPVWLIPGVSPIRPTGIYRRVLVDRDSGLLACRFVPGHTDYRVVQFWPSELTQVFAEAGIVKEPPPTWQKGCGSVTSAHASASPRIISPARGIGYRVRFGADNRLPLKASLDGGAHSAFWLVDNVPVGSSAPGQTLFWPLAPGRFVVRVVDDAGNADSRTVTVE
jgi:penicillin-binding protein 1C